VGWVGAGEHTMAWVRATLGAGEGVCARAGRRAGAVVGLGRGAVGAAREEAGAGLEVGVG
jgi:hypothetical protein